MNFSLNPTLEFRNKYIIIFKINLCIFRYRKTLFVIFFRLEFWESSMLSKKISYMQNQG